MHHTDITPERSNIVDVLGPNDGIDTSLEARERSTQGKNKDKNVPRARKYRGGEQRNAYQEKGEEVRNWCKWKCRIHLNDNLYDAKVIGQDKDMIEVG